MSWEGTPDVGRRGICLRKSWVSPLVCCWGEGSEMSGVGGRATRRVHSSRYLLCMRLWVSILYKLHYDVLCRVEEDTVIIIAVGLFFISLY